MARRDGRRIRLAGYHSIFMTDINDRGASHEHGKENYRDV
jgi:hypothetical protein